MPPRPETRPLKELFMSPNRRLRRSLPLLLLLAALVFAGLPVQAAARRSPARPSAKIWRVAVLGESAFSWLRNLLMGLWMPAGAKEGMTIDPDGQPHQNAVPDEGMTIDPNG